MEDQRCVQQCECAPRARCSGTYLYTLCVKPDTSTSRTRLVERASGFKSWYIRFFFFRVLILLCITDHYFIYLFFFVNEDIEDLIRVVISYEIYETSLCVRFCLSYDRFKLDFVVLKWILFQ